MSLTTILLLILGLLWLLYNIWRKIRIAQNRQILLRRRDGAVGAWLPNEDGLEVNPSLYKLYQVENGEYVLDQDGKRIPLDEKDAKGKTINDRVRKLVRYKVKDGKANDPATWDAKDQRALDYNKDGKQANRLYRDSQGKVIKDREVQLQSYGYADPIDTIRMANSVNDNLAQRAGLGAAPKDKDWPRLIELVHSMYKNASVTVNNKLFKEPAITWAMAQGAPPFMAFVLSTEQLHVLTDYIGDVYSPMSIKDAIAKLESAQNQP